MMDFEKWTYPQFKVLVVACAMWCVTGFLVGRWSMPMPVAHGPLMGSRPPVAKPSDEPSVTPGWPGINAPGSSLPAMPSPYPIVDQNEFWVFGTARMERGGFTTIRLKAADPRSANWDSRLFGSERPVPAMTPGPPLENEREDGQ